MKRFEDWEDVICFGMIILATIIMILLMVIFGSKDVEAKVPNHYPIAGVCKQEMKMIDKAERSAKHEAKKERQRLEEKKKAKKAYEQRLIAIFGYLPTTGAIYRGKCVCMAEGGNTETIIGLERIFEVLANRCRSSRFPNTIDEVIYQRGQFETVSTGRMWKYEVNEKVEKAWNNLIERGYCNDNKVLFFTAGGYNPYCVPAYKLENHYFGY